MIPRDIRLSIALGFWITALLLFDARGRGDAQIALGVVTAAVLALALAHQPSMTRAEALIVVAVAGVSEILFAQLLGVYVYRFNNVPAYVPPAHGLVYLTALELSRMSFLQRHARAAMVFVLIVGGVWAAWGLIASERHDVLGGFWYGCLALFLTRPSSRLLFITTFGVVAYLELLGTQLGVWTWQLRDPTGLVGIGNPPSGVAGGYGWFDVFALALAPRFATHWRAGLAHVWPASRIQPSASSTIPSTIALAPTARRRVSPSARTRAPSSVPKRIPISRAGAT